MASSGPLTMVAEATVLIFCGNGGFEDMEAAGGIASLTSSMGPKRSLVASSVLVHLLTGGFSGFWVFGPTMPSDSDLFLTRLLDLI